MTSTLTLPYSFITFPIQSRLKKGMKGRGVGPLIYYGRYSKPLSQNSSEVVADAREKDQVLVLLYYP